MHKVSVRPEESCFILNCFTTKIQDKANSPLRWLMVAGAMAVIWPKVAPVCDRSEPGAGR